MYILRVDNDYWDRCKFLGEKIIEDNEEIIKTMCSMHCGGQCLLQVHVKNGKITRIATDENDEEKAPQLRACIRGRAQRQKVYSPHRILYPLKRVGKRGEGKFKRISWEEAFATVVGELKRIKETYGNEAIFFYGGGGNITYISDSDNYRRLLNLFGGYSTTWGIDSREAGRYMSAITYGRRYVSNSRSDLFNTRLIILWGFNPSSSILYPNTPYLLNQLREKGVRIVAVDPRYTETAAICAEQWIPIRPSTDVAMLIAMAYVIVKENLHDQKFLDRYTVGFEKYKEYLMGKEDGIAKTPQWAEEITGVPASTIEGLAKEYATTKPAALIAGIGPGRTSLGGQYHRSAHVLAAMTGNVGIHGGDPAAMSAGGDHPFRNKDGVEYPFQKQIWGMNWGSMIPEGKNPVDEKAGSRKLHQIKNYMQFQSLARVHIMEINDALLKGKAGGYPNDYKMFWVGTRNPVNQMPNTRKWHEALTSDKVDFVLTHEQFMSATARYADIVLPSPTLFERDDVIATGDLKPYFGYQNKIIEPLGECKTHCEIARELAKRLGINDAFLNKTEREHAKDFAEEVGIDFEKWRKEGVHHVKVDEPYVAFKRQIEDPENNPFPTPSGKIEIYSEQLGAINDPLIPPIPKYIQIREGPKDPLSKKYPLQFISYHIKRRAHSQFELVPWLRELQPQVLTMNPMDTNVRGIRDGDLVKIYNDRGVIVIPAKVTERITPGVVAIPQGAYSTPYEEGVDRGGCCNTLTSNKPSPVGALVTNTTLVEVVKA